MDTTVTATPTSVLGQTLGDAAKNTPTATVTGTAPQIPQQSHLKRQRIPWIQQGCTAPWDGVTAEAPKAHPWDLPHGSGHGVGRSKHCFQAHHCFCAKMTQTGWEKPVLHREDEQLWKWEALLTSGHGSGTRVPSPDFEVAVIGLQPRLCSAGASPP